MRPKDPAHDWAKAEEEETPTMSQPTIQVQEVMTIGVPVTDQDQALSFYVNTLGFDKRLDVPISAGKRWIVLAAPHGTATMALVAADDHAPAGIETGIRLTSRNADADHAALRAAGVDTGEILRWPGVPPMFAFRDQDGNRLELVENFGA
jgi:catechol 2,3-dioxygenase-like lactoylglutathione lyase family enzyme